MDRVIRLIAEMGDPWIAALFAFFGASFAGLATQLRTGKDLTRRAVAAAMLNSGFIGAIIALLGYKTFADNVPYLIGMSLLAGIGGATMLDFALQIVRRRFGISIRIEQGRE